MGVQLNLTDIQSGFLSASAHTSNNTLIEEALNKALDRTANVDNAMEVDLDLGSNSLINVNQINGSDISVITSDVTTVANNIDNVNTVATDIANVNSVAGSIANVNTVATNITDIQTVIANIIDINTVATDIANVNAVGTDIASVINVSTNLDAVNNFSDLYLGEREVDPTPGGGKVFTMTLDGVDANGNSGTQATGTLLLDTGGESTDPNPLLTGSLYFNTVANGGAGELRIYNGTEWITAAFAADAANGVSYNNGTSGLLATNVQEAIDEHITSTTAHDAVDIVYDNTSSLLTAEDTQAAIDEVNTNLDTLDSDLLSHLGSETAHDAIEIVYDNTFSGATAINSQDALDNLYGLFVSQDVVIDSGSFSGANSFTLHLRKIGDTVFATTSEGLTHSLTASASSNTASIPAAFRPSSSTAGNVYKAQGGGAPFVGRVAITEAGQFFIDYFNWDGTGLSKTGSSGSISITYSIL